MEPLPHIYRWYMVSSAAFGLEALGTAIGNKWGGDTWKGKFGGAQPGCHHLTLWQGDFQEGPQVSNACASPVVIRLHVFVGPLIHVMLNDAFWLVNTFLPWIEGFLRCVFSLNWPSYKYLPTLMEMVSNKPLPLDWCLSFIYLCRTWWSKIGTKCHQQHPHI